MTLLMKICIWMLRCSRIWEVHLVLSKASKAVTILPNPYVMITRILLLGLRLWRPRRRSIIPSWHIHWHVAIWDHVLSWTLIDAARQQRQSMFIFTFLPITHLYARLPLFACFLFDRRMREPMRISSLNRWQLLIFIIYATWLMLRIAILHPSYIMK